MINSLVAILVLALVGYGTGHLTQWLRRKELLDHPNDRSSHILPTPRGGGLALVPVVVAIWLGLALLRVAVPGSRGMAVAALALMLLSWRDDRAGLPALLRLLGHIAAVTAGLLLLPENLMVFQGLLPWWADRVLAGLLWVWFVNLYNFMDGIDGITGVETLSLGVGLVLVGTNAMTTEAVAIAAAGAAFLWWNWQPAKIFLGDSGSVPLGYLLGGLLLHLAAHGAWVAALILPSYYLADASLTLAMRIGRREKIWQAHRSHFYQRAVQAGASHAALSRFVLLGNAALVLLAWLSLSLPWLAACGTLAVLSLMLGAMARRASRPILR